MPYLALLLAAWLAVSPLASALEVGQSVPDFTSKTSAGPELTLSKVLRKKRGALLVFVGVKCPYSNQYNERLKELAGILAEKEIELIGVNSNATEAVSEIRKHASTHGFAFPIVVDPKAALADQFGAQKTPEVYLVDKERKLLYQGRIDDDTEGKEVHRKDALTAVEEFLAGKPVSVPKTKAFGCTIER